MKRLILLSDSNDLYIIKAYFEKINIQNLSICLVTTAREKDKEQSPWYKKFYKEFSLLNAKLIEPFDFDKDKLSELQRYDVIFFIGGNPFYLMHSIKKSGAVDYLHNLYNSEKIFVSVCAGSIVLGKNFEIINRLTPEFNTVNLTDFNGVALENINVLPHYNKLKLEHKNLENIIENLNLKNILIDKLNDEDYIIFEDGKRIDTF